MDIPSDLRFYVFCHNILWNMRTCCDWRISDSAVICIKDPTVHCSTRNMHSIYSVHFLCIYSFIFVQWEYNDSRKGSWWVCKVPWTGLVAGFFFSSVCINSLGTITVLVYHRISDLNFNLVTEEEINQCTLIYSCCVLRESVVFLVSYWSFIFKRLLVTQHDWASFNQGFVRNFN